MTIQKVLVVDDSKTELMALSDILQKQGLQVRTAENGEEAMKRLAEDKPDPVKLTGGTIGKSDCKHIDLHIGAGAR